MADMERSVGLELRFAPDQAGVVTGYAAVWNRRDVFGDLVQPGAFARSLAAHRAAGTRPLMLRSHDPRLIVGTWQDISEDATGLKVTGTLVLESRDGADTHALLKAGAMDGLSIGFRTRRATPAKGGGRLVHQVDLFEISLVGRPAQHLARVASVRAAPDFPGLAADIRRFTAQLRVHR